MNDIKNNRKLVRALAMVAGITILSALPGYAREIVLKEGTSITLKTVERLSSKKNRKGDVVKLLVAEAVKDVKSGRILIKEGAAALGVVTKARPAGFCGNRGRLSFEVSKVESEDGNWIPVSPASHGSDGDSSSAAVYAGAALITPVALLFKGGNVIIEAGSGYTVTVAKDTFVSLPDASSHRMPSRRKIRKRP